MVGASRLDDERAVKTKVDYAIYHEYYEKWHNDIGLIHLSTPLSFNEKIDKIELQNTTLESEKLTAVLTGWGVTEVIFYSHRNNLLNFTNLG